MDQVCNNEVLIYSTSNNSNIIKNISSMNDRRIVFDNGDIIKLRPSSETVRGEKADRLFLYYTERMVSYYVNRLAFCVLDHNRIDAVVWIDSHGQRVSLPER